MRKICLLLALAMLLCLLPACGDEEASEPAIQSENKDPNPDAAISLDTATLTLPVGFTTEINASIVPRFETDDTTLKFATSNKKIVKVSAKNNVATVTAVAEGSATITVTSADGMLSASCDITVVAAGENIPTGTEKTPNPNAGITLDITTLTLPVGASSAINADIIPQFDTDDLTLSFTTEGNQIISIAAEGNTCTIKALSAGSAVITVKNANGQLSAACTVTVTDDGSNPDKKPNPNAGITLNKISLSLNVGSSETLSATLIPLFEDDDKTLSFTSQNTKIATVNASGKITAVAEGSTVITVKSADGQLSAACTVTVKANTPTPNPNAGITLDQRNISLKVGSTKTLSATFVPLYDTDSKTLTFESSNPKIATVDANGKITAVAEGSAVITVQNANKQFSASCTVTVSKSTVNPTELTVVDYPASKVRHIFSHCLIAYPEMGCGDPDKGNGSLDVDCLTVSEFQILLQSLYDNGYCLIDINDMYENYTENGVVKSRLKKNVQVYEGKKPLVISVDDVVYDSRKLDWGMIDRLEIQNDSIIGVKNFNGELVYSDKEIFPQLEKFLETHPDFSFQGAKCTLALTGFEGILGYRTDDQFADQGIDYMAERKKAQVVVDWLKANGYNFASHSYSHSNYTTCAVSRVERDIERWNSQVKPLIGETKVFVYPYGAWTNYGTEKHNLLLKEGFTVFCGTSQTNCLWDQKHPKQKDANGSTIATKTGSIYLERYTITGQTLRDWRDFDSMYDYCDPYATYDHENRFIPMPKKSED